MSDLRNSMLDMLTCAYHRKPSGNIGKLLSIFADGLSAVERALSDTREWRDINTTAGIALDRLGANYGVSRSGADDVVYRLMIMTKMMAAYSGGDPNTLIHVCAALMDIDESEIQLTEGVARVILTVNELNVPDAFFGRQEMVCDLLQQAAAAGIMLILELQRNLKMNIYHAAVLHTIDEITLRQVN